MSSRFSAIQLPLPRPDAPAVRIAEVESERAPLLEQPPTVRKRPLRVAGAPTPGQMRIIVLTPSSGIRAATALSAAADSDPMPAPEAIPDLLVEPDLIPDLCLEPEASAPLIDDPVVTTPCQGIPRVHREGDVLAGRYRLLHRLGEGGMGSVWKARCLALDVDVAVKVVKRNVASPQTCERLLREARSAAALAHPSIVRVLDFGTTADAEPFLVMQLLQGKTLGARLRERGKIPPATAVQLLLPIVGALAEAHDLGIVHRDIKPENILLEETPEGQLVPKLVDFGIAKQSGGDQSHLTQTGVVVGSPAYMSPEQARGQHDVDPRSDVWSLSVMLYEMIAGKRPFEGPNNGAVLFSVFADTPEPTATLGAGDHELWQIIRRGLAKTPGERWQSMKQLGRALAGWAVAHGLTADAAGVSIPHQWLGRRDTEEVPIGEEISLECSHFSPPAELTTNAFHVHTISTPPPAPRALDAQGGTFPRRRGSVFGLGGALVVLVSVITFLALRPSHPGMTGVAAATPATSMAAPLAPATAEAKPPAATPSTVAVVPVTTAAARAPAATGATSSATLSPAPARLPKPSRPGPAAPSRLPQRPWTGKKLPLPLPTSPDF